MILERSGVPGLCSDDVVIDHGMARAAVQPRRDTVCVDLRDVEDDQRLEIVQPERAQRGDPAAGEVPAHDVRPEGARRRDESLARRLRLPARAMDEASAEARQLGGICRRDAWELGGLGARGDRLLADRTRRPVRDEEGHASAPLRRPAGAEPDVLLRASDDQHASRRDLHDLERAIADVAARGHWLAAPVLVQRLSDGVELGEPREQARRKRVVVVHRERSAARAAADDVGRELVGHEDAVLDARRHEAGLPLVV